VLCIDNNPALLQRAIGEWSDTEGVPVEVVSNSGSKNGEPSKSGSASARNTAAACVSSDIVVFLDDDANPEPEWVERLLDVYSEHPDVVAVGGAPLPIYERPRPRWYPPNFDWVFGCVYDGLPETVGPLPRLIGANMSVRREALERVEGFGTDYPIDDLELCIKLLAVYGDESLYYTPRAVVHHFVSAERLSWNYFRHRCFSVNREKTHLFEKLGPAASLGAERDFVLHTVRRRVGSEIRRAVGGDMTALQSLFVMFAGIGFAAAGRARGLLDVRLRKGHELG
jgi:GT2 family glycosyltransferase